jgi:hypothetical protein
MKSDSIVESPGTKTTLETIRDVITHPIATITEKIQSAISTSSSEHVEETSSDAANAALNESEQTESSEKQPSLETAVSQIETRIIKDRYC